jgi:hypothetical protein
MRRAAPWLVAACLLGDAGCTDDGLQSHAAPAPGAPDAPDDPTALTACRADAESFVLRALPLVHGRRTLGSAEVRVLARVVDDLDARGRDGRRTLARALADGDDYRRRWSSVLFDLLRVRRAGHRVLGRCYGERGPAAETDALARFVLDHLPSEPFPGGPFTMRDLVESSLRADDLRPLLRADLLVRMVAPIDDANTPPDALELARRTNLGRAFETTYLGRRFECLACHTDEASVTDHPDPALDRSWPVARGLERAVYPADEAAMHAVFRWEGFADGEVAPWGAAHGCGGFRLDHHHDPLPTAAALAGALPPGSHALDLSERLHAALGRLYDDGWSDAPADPTAALAQLVVLHLVDELWAAAHGRPLTLDHGLPRNAAQAQRLRSLAIGFVQSRYSLRALLVEIATDPHADQAVPAECEHGGPEPLPAIFDPFTDTNGAGHRVHRRDPLSLYDEAHRLLGRTLPGLVAGEPGFDAARAGALGAYLEESRPGHDGLDLLGALSWEQALAALPDAPAAAPSSALTVTLDDLVALARADRSSSVGDLLVATKDRVLAEPHVDAEERALVEALVGQPWSRPAHELDAAALRAVAWRYARVLLATPSALLSGLEQAPEGDGPRLWPAHARPAALCAHWAPRVLPGERYLCTDRGVALP